MRRLSWLLFIAVCAMPLSAEALRVNAPRADAALRGGSFTTLQWTADALPPHAEEWEAFLSIDGGRYYAFRITPHLDIDRKHFDFLVPNVDTNDARILIRTGDEKRESLFELTQRFTIVRDAHAEVQVPRALANGGCAEAARDGDPVVVAWADGDRAGTRVTLRCATTASTRIAAVGNDARATSPLVAPKMLRASDTIHLAVARATAVTRVARIIDYTSDDDLLLVCRRLNI
jgi:hypothetical protein